MRLTETAVAELVTAAQRGDRQALDRLVAAHLPLVYNIVGRALDGHPDVDDVVQNTMLRAVRELRSLRSPGSFRSWLAAIAVRQAGTHRHQQAGRALTAPLADAVHETDPNAELEDVTALRARLSGQRREVAEATRWLDPDDRAMLSLWWQEVAGLMSRPELAAAAGVSVAHTGVRIQRMREQLDLARTVVAALAARPGCSALAATTTGWDGRPGSLWRKRIVRHVRSCPVCAAAAQDRIPAERLLASLPALAVPAALAEATVVKVTAVGIAGAAAVTGATAAVTGIAAVVVAVAAVSIPLALRPEPKPRSPGIVAVAPPSPSTASAPAETGPASTSSADTGPAGTGPASTGPASPIPAGTVPLGRASFAWVGGGYLAADERSGIADVSDVGADSDAPSRNRATFVVVAGLADPKCVSLRTRDGRYVRHYELEGYAAAFDYSQIFRQDATYCPQPGVTGDSVMLRSYNYPEFCLRWNGTRLGIGYYQDTREFRTAASFRVRAPLAAG